MKKENQSIVITSIISGVILLIAILALVVYRPVGISTQNSVTVQGIAEIKAMPDVISVYFNIETKGDTSAEATTANNEIYNKLVEELILVEFAEEDLKTESFNVYENSYWENGREKTDGYKANHYLKLELSSEEMDKVSSAIDAGVKAEAQISYINFELSQEAQNNYKAQALKQASQDASIKADSIASGFNKEVGKLLSVQTSDFGYYPWNVYASGSMRYAEEDVAMAKEIATSIQPSEQEITATITATFKLK